MKRLLLLLILLPAFVIAQKKKNNGFAYLAPGFYAGKGNNNHFFTGAGVGFRNKQVSLGGSFYYHIKFKASLNADLRFFLAPKEKPGPFIFIQPGISLYRQAYTYGTTKGGFDFKGGIGIMDMKRPGLYAAIGYNSFRLSARSGTFTAGNTMYGLFLLTGVVL